MVPSNLSYSMTHLNLAHTCPCTPLIWSLIHRTDFSKYHQTCHFTRNSLAISALCLRLASLQIPGGDQESIQQVARCLITGPWLWDAEALTRLFFSTPSLSRLPVLSSPSKIPTNYTYKHLRCCLCASIKLLTKILKESDTIQILGVVSEQAPQIRKKNK